MLKEKFVIAKGPAVTLQISIEEGTIQQIVPSLSLSKEFSCTIIHKDDHTLKDLVLMWLEAYAKKENPLIVLPLAEGPTSSFSSQVLSQIKQIPFSKTMSYQDIAKGVGNPLAARAVGNACRDNPFPLVIPCHRVIQKSQEIGGYAYDLKIKKLLLDFEAKSY